LTIKGRWHLKALKGEKTIQEIAEIYEAHPKLVGPEEEDIASSAGEVFERSRKEFVEVNRYKGQIDELYRQLGKTQERT
jgi:hypothetical protein